MKKQKIKLFLASILTVFVVANAHAGIDDFLVKKDIKEKIKKSVSNFDINFSTGFGADVVNGVNLSAHYTYQVEASYQNQYYSRVDKWNLETGIDVGDLVENFVDIPFSFSVNRNNDFLFVRQFKSKKEATKALPYTPKRLPLSAEAALDNLSTGDFVSMPANLNIAVEAKAETATVAPIVLSASASVYYVISGEFIIQVYKIDESHVRLKMISARSYNGGVSAAAGLSFKIFGVRIIDKQIDRFLERDLVRLGYEITPGAQFIVDYVFDLKNPEARDAYDQILKTTFKFKDVVVMDRLQDASDLKDKLISSYEKAEKIFQQDKAKDPKDRRISRIFKGFNDYTGHTKKLKLAAVVATYIKENAYTDNKVTFIDKNENNMEYLYPTFSKYMETKFGRYTKDQAFQTNFGLIPRFNSEDTTTRNPDFGVTFERKDKNFTNKEQRYVQKFLVDQVPTEIGKNIDLSQWKDGIKKLDTRIFLQLVLKADGFNFLKSYTQAELEKRLIDFYNEKNKIQVLDGTKSLEKLNAFLLIKKFIDKEKLEKLAADLYIILKNEKHNSEIMIKDLVKQNEYGIFDKIGVGFLISLLPQDQLQELVYLKIEMTAQKLKPVIYEYGILNHRALYKELTEVQTRIANRSYDLRVTDSDHEMESEDHEQGNGTKIGLN